MKPVLWPKREGAGEQQQNKKQFSSKILRDTKHICNILRHVDVQAPLIPEIQVVFKRLRNISDSQMCYFKHHSFTGIAIPLLKCNAYNLVDRSNVLTSLSKKEGHLI